MRNSEKGLLVVLSSPSGGGKTTVIKKILNLHPKEYVYSISMTTRPKRAGETDGIDYFFVSRQEFEQHIRNGHLLEYENVHGQYYGTPLKPLNEWIEQNFVVLLDIDVYGAQKIKERYNRSLLVFIKPPDVNVLIERLKKRSTESDKQIEKRLDRLPEEMAYAEKFDYIVVNDKLSDTVEKVHRRVKEYRKQ